MMSEPLVRRQFLKASAAFGMALSAGQTPAEGIPPLQNSELLRIHPRYHRWHVDPGEEWLETNTGYAQLDWSIPRSQVALVLVDVWSEHYLRDASARADAIVRERYVPLLAGCRKAGLTVIHAPSPPQALTHPNYVGASSNARSSGTTTVWPPSAFRGKTGPFQQYRRPVEPREPEVRAVRERLTIHPLAQPVGSEPVVSTGDELHALCRERGILFLLYAGFNTNACILVRDYGTLAMSQRGYEVVLLRDCTTGMETPQTQPALAQTNGAVLFLEMFGQYSTTSDDVLAGLS